jgi:hypothetical protein
MRKDNFISEGRFDMTKNRCSPITLVLFSAIGAFLICAAIAQAAAAAGPVASNVTAAVRSVQPALSGPVGTFVINPFPDTCNAATDPSCAFYDVCVKEAPDPDLNNPSCTANDVQLTEIVEGSLEVLEDLDGGIGCDGESDADDTEQCPWGGDCVTFTATGHYVLTSQTRYDIGTFLALFPSGATQDGAKSGECLRFAYTNTDTVQLDTDSCGDLDQATAGLAAGGVNIDFGPVTVPCVDDGEGNIVINHCETWSQRNNEINCQGSDDVQAGTGSKCNCGVLSGICIAVNSENACITNVCRGACQPASGTGGSGTDCFSSADCTVEGETCQNIVLVGDETECPDLGECHEPSTCDPDTGECSHVHSDEFTPCTITPAPPAGACQAADTCDADGNCVDRFATGGVCRAAENECDAAESCDGTGPDCPADFCGPAVARPTPFCSNGT